ncbi:MAG: FecR domain-containing protein, partial [Planctomycetota bacterium]
MSNNPTNNPAPDRDDERYLWDRSDPVDPTVSRLEQVLGTLRYAGEAELPEMPAGRGVNFQGWLALAAAIAAAAVGGWLVLGRETTPPPGFAVQAVAGIATIDTDPLANVGRLGVGSWLETDAGSRAQVRVADIGSVTVHPNSRLGLVETRADRVHRLQLDHGRIEALITAPPRLFLVNTPSAVAVDLGCAYTLEVDEAGNGALEVGLGWVALEANGFTSTVPMDAACRLRAGTGPGVPCFVDAGETFRAAVDQFDADLDHAAGVVTMLAEARPRDTLTLWHLLPRVQAMLRRPVVDRIIE